MWPSRSHEGIGRCWGGVCGCGITPVPPVRSRTLNGTTLYRTRHIGRTSLASELAPLLFFKPRPDVDSLSVAPALLGEAPPPNVVPFDPATMLQAVRNTRGFSRLKVALPHFSFENPRAGAALDGTALPTHIRVGFFGNFEKVAEPFFEALTTAGLVCYSLGDKSILTRWPKRDEPTIDRGFAGRIGRILQRKTIELRETEPDERRRRQILDTFVNSPEFRAEMAREARREPGRGKKSYDDVVNCYVRWKDGRATASELGAVRKLDPKLAAMSLSELRAHVGDAPRLLLVTAALPQRTAELRRSAEGLGLSIESEYP